jgi:hypothetical protein
MLEFRKLSYRSDYTNLLKPNVMKSWTLTGAVLLLACMAWGQSLQPTVIANGGGGNDTGPVLMDWTIGQVAVHTAPGTAGVLTQGFLQPTDFLNPVLELSTGWVVSVFPNPASEVLYLTGEDFPINSTIRYDLIDLNGRVLLSGIFDGALESMDVSAFPTSVYLLRLVDEEGVSASFKILIQ